MSGLQGIAAKARELGVEAARLLAHRLDLLALALLDLVGELMRYGTCILFVHRREVATERERERDRQTQTDTRAQRQRQRQREKERERGRFTQTDRTETEQRQRDRE